MDHILREKNAILDWKNNRSPIALFQMFKKINSSAWAKMLLNSYYRALQIKGQGQIKYAKIRLERQKERESKVSFSNIRTFMRLVGYLWIALLLMGMFVPGLVINYIKEQIKQGEWVDTQPVVTTVQKQELQIDET